MTLRCHTAVMVAEEPTHQSSISNQDYTSSSVMMLMMMMVGLLLLD
jgi:hypothetical protein